MEAAREFLTVSNDKDGSVRKALLCAGPETDSTFSSPFTPSEEFGTEAKPSQSREAQPENPLRKARSMGHEPNKRSLHWKKNTLLAILPFLFIGRFTMDGCLFFQLD